MLNLLIFFSEQCKPQHLEIYLKEAKIFLLGERVLKIEVIYPSEILWVRMRSGIHSIFFFQLNATENRTESCIWIPHSSLTVLFQVIEKNKASQRQVEWTGKKFKSVIVMCLIWSRRAWLYHSQSFAQRKQRKGKWYSTVPPWSETGAWLWLHSVPLPL